MSASLEKYDIVFKVGELYQKGYSNYEIKQELGISGSEVSKAVTDYKAIVASTAKNNMSLTDRVYLIIEEVDQHYAMITKEAWRNKEDAEAAEEYGIVNATLKTLAQVQKQRADMHKHVFDKQDDALIEQLEFTEQRQQQLIGILKTLRDKFPEAAQYIQKELQSMVDDPLEVEIVD